MPRPALRIWLIAIPILYFLYFFGLARIGLVGPDEPRYAAIGREMASSGDWVTPRLWGEPWFEKPALLYWMTATAFRAGLGEELAPRLPVALVGAGFLFFFYGALRKEFGDRAAAYGTAILATSAGWLSLSHIGVTDIPMSAAFIAAMLLSLGWIERGERRRLPWAAALLGVAVLAKGLVPLVLALPLALMGWRRLMDWLRPQMIVSFAVIALPWYVLCFVRNGRPFLETFFWEHQVERFRSTELAHGQPFWFLLPVLVVALFPWVPALVVLFRRSLYSDARRRFLLTWVVWGLIFFSASANKLPSYVLPLVPALAALAGIALAEYQHTRWILSATAALLVLIGPIATTLPEALAAGISRAGAPAFHWVMLLPLIACAVVWYVDRAGHRVLAAGLLVAAITAGVVSLELRSFPAIDQAASARPLWISVAPIRDRVCVARLHRSLRYGLNYYSVTPLPDCRQEPREVEITQDPGSAPRLVSATAVPASWR
ncbi:MAG TPA: glycosyltransferase family 39 protein [Bryobacteraceae bacterium]|nr:glycosyltransferase family 39 protein [Bryobacteraceae bacterium]